MNESMPCPRCGEEHERGQYVERLELALPNSKGKPYAPPDVQCDCGALLRHSVPVMKVNATGWVWRIL